MALFVCCGSTSNIAKEEDPDPIGRARSKYLEEKAAEYNLQPVALGLFGGVYNYNKVPWWSKRVMDADRARIEAAFKETQPRVYDTRDWNAIRSWAKELSQKVHP